MKRSIVLLSLFGSLLFAQCKIVSSPATNISDVAGVDAYAMSISKVYYDKQGKIQLKSYQDAYISFFNTVLKAIEDSCAKYGIRNIYNLKIDSKVDKNSYYFSATYDFGHSSK